ncbi:hypothetical protein LINPERHAP1_LOCUS12772 [Linum perenne]
MLSWSPTVFGSCRSVFRPYLARLKSKRRTVRTSGIRTTRRTFLDRNKSRQLGKGVRLSSEESQVGIGK